MSGPRYGFQPCRGRLGFRAAEARTEAESRSMCGWATQSGSAQRRATAEALSAWTPLASIFSARASSSDADSSSPAARRRRLP